MTEKIISTDTPGAEARLRVTLVIYLAVMVLGAFIACSIFNDDQVLNVQLPFVLYVVLKVCFCLTLGSLLVIFICATRDGLANRTSHPAGLLMPIFVRPAADPVGRINNLFRPPRLGD